MSTKTPRTDAVERGFTADSKQNPQYRLTERARELERELADAKAITPNHDVAIGILVETDDEARLGLKGLPPENQFARLAEAFTEQKRELAESRAYADSLAEGLPCLPKDVEVLREANGKFTQRITELERELAKARKQLHAADEECSGLYTRKRRLKCELAMARAQVSVWRQSAEGVEKKCNALQHSLDALYGAKFSDRCYYALKSRVENAEQERDRALGECGEQADTIDELRFALEEVRAELGCRRVRIQAFEYNESILRDQRDRAQAALAEYVRTEPKKVAELTRLRCEKHALQDGLREAMEACRNGVQYIATTAQWARWQALLGEGGAA